MTWRMPAEGELHERTWMAYPSEGYSLGDTPEEHHEARTTWAEVAHAVARFEPVTVVVDPGQVSAAEEYLSADIDIVAAPLNDAWMRDIGPTFVLSEDGHLGGVDWIFNGWGGQDWPSGTRTRRSAHWCRAVGGPNSSTHRSSTRAAASMSTASAPCW